MKTKAESGTSQSDAIPLVLFQNLSIQHHQLVAPGSPTGMTEAGFSKDSAVYFESIRSSVSWGFLPSGSSQSLGEVLRYRVTGLCQPGVTAMGGSEERTGVGHKGGLYRSVGI